jgi:Putative Ig domain
MSARTLAIFVSFRRFLACIPLVVAILVAGCSSSNPKISIVLSPASPQNAIGAQVIPVMATLTHDTKAAGVMWTLTGSGALSGQTTSAVTYTAPATIPSASTATITATSVTDPTVTSTLTINLTPISVTLNPNTAQTLDQTKTVSVTATVTSDPASKGVTWSLSAGAAGTLSNQTATSVTYNAPATVTSASSPVLTATSISDNTKTANLTINLVAPPSVSTAALAAGTVSTPYSATLAASGGVTPDTWSITTGTLPAGLLLNASTGAITGTPTASGTSNITVKVTDADGLSAMKGFTITIDQQPAITSANSVTFTVNTPGSFAVTSTAFPTAALTETGALPVGVTFVDNGNGTATLAGTATTSGSFPITINANNGVGTAATQNFTLTVGQAPAITSGASTTFTVGSAGTFSVTTTGFPAPSLTETGALPSGVTFVDNGNGTAKLSGTPAAATGGTYSITIKAHNGSGSDATQTFTLTVDQAPAITSANATSFSVNAPGSFTVTTTGFPKAALTETGALPTGVTFVDNGNGTATLAGTPITSGPFPITINANNGIGTAATQNFTLTVGQAPAITSGVSTTFTVGSAGTFSVTTTGFPAPSLTETGALPSGVTFVDNGNGTAKLSGTPAAATGGTYSITIKAHNGSGTDATQTFTLTVDQAPAITSANATSFSVNAPGSFTVTTTGFPKPALTETGALPAGVNFVDNGNGTATLSGTATAQGSFPITITANNGVGSNATQAFTLTVNTAPAFTSVNHATFTVGTAGTFTVTATGTPTPSLSETGALPSGVTFNSTTGVLSGTPAAGTGKTYSITFTASNGVGTNATQTFTLTVDQAPAITSAASTTFTVGTFASFTVMTSGFPAPALTETGLLPSGVTFTDNGNGTATLSGTPASGTAATYPITITANNGVTPNGTQSFTLTVNTAPVITSGASATFTVGTPGTFTVTTTGAPTPALTETGALPNGVTFTDNGNGTATLGGTPTVGGTFSITIKATNASGNTTQSFILTVDQAPAFTSSTSTTFTVGGNGSFTVTTTGTPSPSLVETGALPSGVTFTDNGKGTGSLSGTPATGTAGSYPITFTATNGIGTPAVQSFTLTVSTQAACTAGGSESLLSGQYAFLVKGFDAGTAAGETSGPEPVVVGGVLTFNGTNNNGLITAGTIDINQNSGFTSSALTSGSYGVTSDHRGCMVITTAAGTQNYRFSLSSVSGGVASRGKVIDFDTFGPFTAGIIEKQTTTAFNTTQVTGNYAFGVSSPQNTQSCNNTNCGGKFGAVGVFNLSSGNVSGGEVDFNQNGQLDGNSLNTTWPASPVSINSGGTYTISSTTGRGMLQFTPNAQGASAVNNVIYVVSSTEVLVLNSDPQTGNSVYAGSLLKQSGSLSGNPLSGSYVGYDSALGSGGAGTTRADVYLLGPLTSGNNNLAGTQLRNDSGTFSSGSISGQYSVTAAGRMTITGGGGNHQPILYLVSTSQAFFLNSNGLVDSGFFQSQTGTSISGTYAFGTLDPEDPGVNDKVGVANFASGNVSVTQDKNGSGSQGLDQVMSQTFSADSNGLVHIPSGCTITASSTTCQNVSYVVSPTKVVLITTSSSAPDVQIADQ